MKNNTVSELQPQVAMPRLCRALENLADNLAIFAEEFGIKADDNLPRRLAVIGFANGIVLGVHEAADAARLEAILEADAVPRAVEIAGAGASFADEYVDQTDWTAEVGRILGQRWVLSADNGSGIGYPAEVRLRTLQGVRFGLAVAREKPETAGAIFERVKVLPFENRFLSGRLIYWSDRSWVPTGKPFIEFVGNWYKAGSVEQEVISGAVAEVYPIAKALGNPWSLPFWAETGWNGGRLFARNRPGHCKWVLEDAGEGYLEGYLEGCRKLYQRYIVGTARADGAIQLERATLCYLGEHRDGDVARWVCTGREPRHIARTAYDFTYWMGIFSAHPLPNPET